MRRILALIIVAVAVLAVAILRLAAWPGVTVSEWRAAPAGGDLDVVFDEPSHPPWSW